MATAVGFIGGLMIGALLYFAHGSSAIIVWAGVFGGVVGLFGPWFSDRVNEISVRFQDACPNRMVCDSLLAVGTVTAASVVWMAMEMSSVNDAFLLFLVPVALCSLISRGAGGLAVLLSAIAVEYYVVPPAFSFALNSVEDARSAFLFTCAAFVACVATMFQRDFIVMARGLKAN